MTIRVAFFIADGFQPLDLFGPLDTFEEANSFLKNSYQCDIVNFQAGPVKSASRHSVVAVYSLTDIPQPDYLVICGGSGMRELTLSTRQVIDLKKLADASQKIISICTGTFILAQLYPDTPLTVTTHWRHCSQLSAQYPNCEVLSDPLFIQYKQFYSSAGILSGVDLSLELVRQDLGNTVAASVAKELVVYLQRKGSQNQFSDLLKTQSSDSLRLNPVIEWMMDNLQKPISCADIAHKMCVSERQVSRLFKQHVNLSPAQYLTQLRMFQARDLISQDNRSLQEVSRLVGFKNYESFRRSFERYFGLSPSTFKP
ncbi:helix-turn-helix domain-containing protein [Paraglaciecola aquimarina]|uniref:Helix-turn-helix domain-containing protein n=1 Tax=Paraglaciecola algarum TaxID=3050085 RepID=A0ABS9D126_9ALTE|nr:helix-turn-helix domain-containing protein [Paraglaciecola sp. G1-23]MCF2946634.1 helix-turn-helix domain-containing protein [Paraglaciecola sp. G1-23]